MKAPYNKGYKTRQLLLIKIQILNDNANDLAKKGLTSVILF